jgi:TonB family protein
MSKGQLVSCYVLSAAALVAAAWFVAASFPLEASPQFQVQQGSMSTQPLDYVSVVVSGFPEPILSKMRARMEVFQGRPYSMELRAEIARAAKEVDPAARVPFMTQIETPEGSLVTTFSVTNSEIRYTVPGGPAQIDVSLLSEPLRSTMRARLAPFEGQQYSRDLRNKVLDAAREIDARAAVGRVQQSRAADGRLITTLGITLYEAPQASPPTSETRIPVSGADQSARLINMVRPQYPPLARQARIQGTVRFGAVIDKEGRVSRLTLVSGHPLLVQAAQEAVRQWTYQPALLDGQPVEVFTEIDVNFTVPQGPPPSSPTF